MDTTFTQEEVKAARAAVEFDGEPVRLGREIYIVPSLSVSQAKKLWPKILAMDKTGVTVEELPDKQEQIVDIVHTALTRNYPNLPRERLDHLVDLTNVKRLMLLVMANSGLQGAAATGEMEPVVGVGPRVH